MLEDIIFHITHESSWPPGQQSITVKPSPAKREGVYPGTLPRVWPGKHGLFRLSGVHC